MSSNSNIFTLIGVCDNSTIYNSFVNGNVTFVTFFLYYYMYQQDSNTLLWSYNSFDYKWINYEILCDHPKTVIGLVVDTNNELKIKIHPALSKPKKCYAIQVPCIFSNINEQFCTYFDILK